jgi:hypothetical protein
MAPSDQQAEKRAADAYFSGMPRYSVILLLAMLAPRPVRAQQWQAGDSIDLVRRAVQQRSARDADALIASWQALAHGVLRYAAVINHGGDPVERVIRADELQVQVYGESPNRSKQVLRAWRDTSFLPNALVYHRDHLGIVANDFGATIRLGQGDEVRDVPHPLSSAGLSRYLYLPGDTVTVASGGRRLRVVAVQVRPREPTAAGTIGTLYLDADRAELVRFQFTFTPPSYRDRTVSSITVTLENALQQHSRWLPWHQSIVIERGEPLLDLGIRTVIRADWTIDDYQLGVVQPTDRFTGAFIQGPLAPFAGGKWPGPLSAQLSQLPATTADVDAVTLAASAAVGGRLLDGLPRLRLSGRGISDFVRVNRVEGVALAAGAGLAARSLTVRAQVGLGLSDQRATGSIVADRRIGGGRIGIFGSRLVQDVGDQPVISGVANSIGTLLSGDDFGDYALVSRVGGFVAGRVAGAAWRLSLLTEHADSMVTRFAPLGGEAGANPSLGASSRLLARFEINARNLRGFGWDASAEQAISGGMRLHLAGAAETPMPAGRLQWHVEGGLALGSLPSYRDFVLGGRGTLPGIPFRSLGGRRMAFADLAWVFPVPLPTPPIPYSRYIHLATTIGPYLAAGVAGGDDPKMPWRGEGAVQPVVGVRLDLWGPLVRVETGTSLRTGHTALILDIHPDWWALM